MSDNNNNNNPTPQYPYHAGTRASGRQRSGGERNGAHPLLVIRSRRFSRCTLYDVRRHVRLYVRPRHTATCTTPRRRHADTARRVDLTGTIYVPSIGLQSHRGRPCCNAGTWTIRRSFNQARARASAACSTQKMTVYAQAVYKKIAKAAKRCSVSPLHFQQEQVMHHKIHTIYRNAAFMPAYSTNTTHNTTPVQTYRWK